MNEKKPGSSKKLKNSLANQLIKITVLPLIVLTAVIVSVSVSVLYNSMATQVEEEMSRDADLVMLMYDKIYNGDFSYKTYDDGTVDLYKGGELLAGDDSVMSTAAEMMDVEISLFLDDTRILSTLKDADGNSAVGTKCSAVVKRDVLKTGESEFYANVTVYDSKAYAFYKPLISADGTVYGMIAVCRTSSVVLSDAAAQIWPIVMVCIMAALAIALIMYRFTKKLRTRIADMDIYMDLLAAGEFNAELPGAIMADDDELKRLAREAKKMAKAIQNLVDYDALTELNNRRYGEKKIVEIQDRAAITGEQYCVCIGDIDFFKKVNDTYGHEMGDIVLKAVADKLKVHMKGKGFAARWGGEEFLLVFDGCDLDLATKLLTELLTDVRTIVIPNTEQIITMSFGITLANPLESPDETLKRADANLYEAKEGGRNQIVSK